MAGWMLHLACAWSEYAPSAVMCSVKWIAPAPAPRGGRSSELRRRDGRDSSVFCRALCRRRIVSVGRAVASAASAGWDGRRARGSCNGVQDVTKERATGGRRRRRGEARSCERRIDRRSAVFLASLKRRLCPSAAELGFAASAARCATRRPGRHTVLVLARDSG